MARKRWEAKTEITPELLKFREKRKWQIALRRYVIEENTCVFYAPYFGLDIQNMRKWFEYQFTEGLTWVDFGKTWQFEHIIPVTYFDFEDEMEMRQCWSFLNLRVDTLRGASRSVGFDLIGAKKYFHELFAATNYQLCASLLAKLSEIEASEHISIAAQQRFLLENRDYLQHIEGYSSFEFELLNTGRSLPEVQKEIDFMKKYSS